jgi:hypothetical protein
MIAVRGLGVFVRVLLAGILYAWLAKYFRTGTAAVAALTTIVVSAGDAADPLNSYNHETILWTVAAGFLASFALDGRSSTKIAMFAGLSGIFAALALCTKQTIGLGAVVAIPVTCVILLARLDGFPKATSFAAGFVSGCAVPIGALFLWLAHNGLVATFLQQLFVRGPAAKDVDGTHFLMRALYVAVGMLPSVIVGVAAWIVLRKAARQSDIGANSADTNSLRELFAIFVLGGVAIAGGAFFAGALWNQLLVLPTAAIYFVYVGCVWLGIRYGRMALMSSISRRQAQYCLFAGVSFVICFMLSLSWPAGDDMVIPGLAFLMAAVMDGCDSSRRWIGIAACGALLFSTTCLKLDAPHGFEGFFELPVRQATTRSTLPEMSGFLLPPGMVHLLDDGVRIVRENTTDGDTIFTYPGLGLFHSLTGRPWPTVSGEENIDMITDALARQEAKTLLERRPKVIFYYRQPEDYLHSEELFWRQGKRSGQRDIIAALETLIKEYRLAATFDAAATKRTVLVYVRP